MRSLVGTAFIAGLCALTHGAMATDLLLYGGNIDYSGVSDRQDGPFQGVYIGTGDPDRYWEVAVDQVRTTGTNTHALTLVHTRYPRAGSAWRIGLHGSDEYEGSLAAFAGLRRYSQPGDHWGGDLALADIPHHDARAVQLNLSTGHSIASDSTFYMDMSFQLRMGVVRQAGDHQGSGAGEASVTLYERPVSLTLSGWGGQERYPLKADGFVHYTDDYVHTGGWKVKLDYLPGNATRLSLSLLREQLELADGGRAHQAVLLGLFAYSW